MLSLLREGFFQMGGDVGRLKVWKEEPSVSNNYIIDVIGVTKMSMQSFTRLVGIGSKSEDFHGIP